jgi:hypothetical protein
VWWAVGLVSALIIEARSDGVDRAQTLNGVAMAGIKVIRMEFASSKERQVVEMVRRTSNRSVGFESMAIKANMARVTTKGEATVAAFATGSRSRQVATCHAFYRHSTFSHCSSIREGKAQRRIW